MAPSPSATGQGSLSIFGILEVAWLVCRAFELKSPRGFQLVEPMQRLTMPRTASSRAILDTPTVELAAVV